MKDQKLKLRDLHVSHTLEKTVCLSHDRRNFGLSSPQFTHVFTTDNYGKFFVICFQVVDQGC